MGGSCELRPEYIKAQEKLKDYNSKYQEVLTLFPILRVGHSGEKKNYQDLPAFPDFARPDPSGPQFSKEMSSVFEAKKGRLLKDIKKTMRSFCVDDPAQGGVGWEELVQMPELTQSVLDRFPAFDLMHKCVEETLDKNSKIKLAASLSAGLGCIPLGVVTAGFGYYACTAAFVGKAYLDRVKSMDRVHWTNRCLAAGDAVCEAEALEKAREELESATTELAIAAVGAVLIDVPLLVKQLRGIKSIAKIEAAELGRLAAKARAAKTPEKMLELADQIYDLRVKRAMRELEAATNAEQIARAEQESINAARDAIALNPTRAKELKMRYSDLFAKLQESGATADEEGLFLAILSKLEQEHVDPTLIRRQVEEWLAQWRKVCET